MNFPKTKTNGNLDLKNNRDDQILIPKHWSPQYPMYDGDATPSPGTYYANLKTPDGSMFKRYFHLNEITLLPLRTISLYSSNAIFNFSNQHCAYSIL